jgi:hypothetical protein
LTANLDCEPRFLAHCRQAPTQAVRIRAKPDCESPRRGERTGESDVARQLRCRLQGLHRAAYWRAQGFPNLARARAVQAKLRAQRRREEAARQFSPHALGLSKFGERYEDLLPPPKRSRPRDKQVYKSRLKVLRSLNKAVRSLQGEAAQRAVAADAQTKEGTMAAAEVLKAANRRFLALLGVGGGVNLAVGASWPAGKRLAVLVNSESWRLNVAG